MNCNANLDRTTYALDTKSLDNECSPRVIMNTPHACPIFSLGALGDMLEHYSQFLGLPMIVIGSYLVFLAGQFPSTTLMVFTTLSVSVAKLLALYLFVFPEFIPTWTVPFVYFVTLGMGAGLGYGAAKWPKIGIVVMGLSMGSLIGFIIYYALMINSFNSNIAKVITVGSAAITFAMVYGFLFDQMIIVTSSVFGAYIFIRVSLTFVINFLTRFYVYRESQCTPVDTLMNLKCS